MGTNIVVYLVDSFTEFLLNKKSLNIKSTLNPSLIFGLILYSYVNAVRFNPVL